MRGPDMTLLAQGRDACVQWYLEHPAPAGEPKIEVFDDMAVAKVDADTFILVSSGSVWQIAWRAVLGGPAAT